MINNTATMDAAAILEGEALTMKEEQELYIHQRNRGRRRRRRWGACHSTGKPTTLVTTRPFSAMTLCLWVIVLLTLSSASSFRPFFGAGASAHHPSTVTSNKGSSRKQPRHLPSGSSKTKNKDSHALKSAATMAAPRTFSWPEIESWPEIDTGTLKEKRNPYRRNIRKAQLYRIIKTRRRDPSISSPAPPLVTEYEDPRTEEWARRYTNPEKLRELFGENQNKMWGDLDATTCRKLYKTLVPKALLELVRQEHERAGGEGSAPTTFEAATDALAPEVLAPLAYKARKAAKLYARERCQVPARIAAQLFDAYRAFKKYGKFQPCGMSYEQLWDKYYKQVVEEEQKQRGLPEQDAADDDVTAKICQIIIEKSCQTNEFVDSLVLSEDEKEAQAKQDHEDYLEWMAERLEEDVRHLLRHQEDAGEKSYVPQAHHQDARLVSFSDVNDTWSNIKVLCRSV